MKSLFISPEFIIFFSGSLSIWLLVWHLRNRPQPSDFSAIEAFAKDRNLRVTNIICHRDELRYWKNAKYWKYSLKIGFFGRLSRFVIIHAQSPDGTSHEIHGGFCWSYLPGFDDLVIFQEKAIASVIAA